MSDPRRNGQLSATDVDNLQYLAAQLTSTFEKINPGVYATECGGLIEIRTDLQAGSSLLTRLFPEDATVGLHLLELLIICE